VRPRLVDVCAEIEASPVPVTLQHGDLHPGNVFAVGTPGGGAGPRAANRALRVFDFGDVQWAPAVEVLSVPFGVLTEEDRLPWRPILDAYTEAWRDLVDGRTLTATWEASAFTQPVNRAQTWWGALAATTDEELADWGVAPLHHLRRVLDA
jgi:Ser/Thr protein kinase RdoA (MazF antagonist)